MPTYNKQSLCRKKASSEKEVILLTCKKKGSKGERKKCDMDYVLFWFSFWVGHYFYDSEKRHFIFLLFQG